MQHGHTALNREEKKEDDDDEEDGKKKNVGLTESRKHTNDTMVLLSRRRI
jgi:hypothetical protein